MTLFWRAIYLATLTAQLALCARWLYRHHRDARASGKRAPRWTSAEAVAVAVTASNAADLAGPWGRVDWLGAWDLSRLTAIGTWLAVAALQVWYLARKA